MVTLLSLPSETLIHLLGYVDPNNLKSLRTICKRFESTTTPLFAKKFMVNRRHTMTLGSIKVLEDIVTHDSFGPFVRSVAFNCVYSISPIILDEEDIPDSIPPFPTGPEESMEETDLKEKEIRKIVQSIRDNHGKIRLGFFFENCFDEQPCHGLVDGLRDGTTDRANGYIPAYSLTYLRDTLRSLLRTCAELNCPVDQVEVDLGDQTALCMMIRELDNSVTVFDDIKEALDDTLLHGTSLDFRYGANDSRYKTFSYNHIRKSVTMFNSPLNQDVLPTPMKRFFGELSVLGAWLEDSQIGRLDLTGAGNCTTSAFSLQNVYLAPCHKFLTHLKLQRMKMGSLSTWSILVNFVSHFPALQTCKLYNLASFELSMNDDQEAAFLEIVFFEAQGTELKHIIRDLAARMEAYEAGWRAEPVDGPGKWRDDLGAKVNSRIQEKGEVAPDVDTPQQTTPQQTTPQQTTPQQITPESDTPEPTSSFQNHDSPHETEETLLPQINETGDSEENIEIAIMDHENYLQIW
jgi:hypothetical protein